MIYLIVNNDVHYMRASFIRDEIHRCDPHARFTLIKFLPSGLTLSDADFLYQHIFESRGLFGGFWQLLDFKLEKAIKRHLDKIPFAKEDILFLFTEYELGNHYLVQRAKHAGARAIIVDEGIGTYIIHNYPRLSQGRSVKQRIIGEVTRWIQQFYDSRRLTGNESVYFPRLKDDYYDGYLLFYNFPIERDIPLIYLQYPDMDHVIKNLNSDSVIVLGDALYRFHLSEKEYIDSLLDITRAATRNFRHVYFKFHPCETSCQNRPLFKDLRAQLACQSANDVLNGR